MRLAVIAAALLVTGPALAESEAWRDVAGQLYADRPLADAGESVAIEAPYRSLTDSRTLIGARVTAPAGDALARVTLVIDENPMPVSADFAFARPVEHFAFDATMRVNGETPVHVVAETVAGRLLVSEAVLKTSGEGACAAPPGTDPALALASLGRMSVTLEPGGGGRMSIGADTVAVVDISHPSHSGLQRDQISLLYIPMRYIERLDISADGEPYATMTGSISLSENPRLRFTVPPGTARVSVELADTGGAGTTAEGVLPGL